MTTETASLAAEEQRHLALAGTYNVRDTGGYPTENGQETRWRTLLRGDSLHRLTPEAQEVLIAAGLRTVIDLRRPHEVAHSPNVFAASPHVRYLHLPIFDGATDSAEQRDLGTIYHAILDDAQPRVREIIAMLAEPGAFPALVHCAAGKDRTGVIVALLLRTAGVPAETVAEDYALSAIYLTEEFYANLKERVIATGGDWARVEPLLDAPATLMHDTLAYIDERYGGVEPYLRGIGVTEVEIATVRAALVA
jgi:protein-tyrosine phosphatase